MKSVAKVLFLKRARDRKSVPMASPFRAVITRSLKNSDLTRVFVDFLYIQLKIHQSQPYSLYLCPLATTWAPFKKFVKFQVNHAKHNFRAPYKISVEAPEFKTCTRAQQSYGRTGQVREHPAIYRTQSDEFEYGLYSRPDETVRCLLWRRLDNSQDASRCGAIIDDPRSGHPDSYRSVSDLVVGPQPAVESSREK